MNLFQGYTNGIKLSADEFEDIVVNIRNEFKEERVKVNELTWPLFIDLKHLSEINQPSNDLDREGKLYDERNSD